MKSKSFPLTINPEKPVAFDISLGKVQVFYDENPRVMVHYTEMGSTEPELNVQEEQSFSFSHIDILEPRIEIYLPYQTGETRITLGTGDLAVAGGKGQLEIVHTNGDIHVDSFSGSLSINKINGNLDLQHFSGQINLEINNGNIRARELFLNGGFMTLKNGKINLEIEKIDTPLEINNQYGSVYLFLAKKANCNLDVYSSKAENYLNNVSEPVRDAQITNFPFQNGGSKILIKALNGKVILAKKEDQDQITTDISSLFASLDKELEKIDKEKIKNSIKGFGKELGKLGKSLFSTLKKEDKTPQTTAPPPAADSSAKLEIIKMLKEGKITAEEAESLLKALK
ncbi:MAG: DUF4097 domain-containing protein [Spirochaetes bacterium]|nr:DUF4097 domain-containing protein [Spirochaetota bacterium]